MIKGQLNFQGICRYNKGVVILTILSISFISLQLWADPAARFYYSVIFPRIRRVFDALHEFIGFPLFYTALLLIVILPLFFLYRAIKRYRDYRNYLCLINYFLFLLLSFQALWGINYRVNPLEEYDRKVIQLESSVLLFHFEKQTSEVNRLRNMVENIPGRSEVRKMLLEEFSAGNDIFDDLGLIKPSPLSIKYLLAGTFLNFNTAGMYFPFTGECLVDNGLHPLQLPSVAAHEWFHASGVTDEGQCNFLSWLFCSKYAGNVLIKYAGELDVWRDMAFAVKRIDPARYAEIVSLLNDQVRQDIKEIQENSLGFSNKFDFLQRMIYNKYLQSQGVAGGIKSYGKVVNYVLFYLENEKDNPVKD